jgi:predicted RNA-binding protein with PUA-like domain
MAYWLFKEDPEHYSFAKLERDGRTVWDGVANNLALQYLRQVAKGDRVLCYHSGQEKAIVGVMEVVKGPRPDPSEKDERLVVVDVKALRRWQRPVTLAQIKADAAFAEWELVRNSRLSVMPVKPELWRRLEELSKRG